MKQKILASEIADIPNFEAAVSAHAWEMKNWHAHMRRVEEDKKNGVPKADAHAPHPAPTAHPMVERAVNENDEPDFLIVEDGINLLRKQATLIGMLSQMELAAIDRLCSPGKRRLADMKREEILRADTTRAQEIIAARPAPKPLSFFQKLAGKKPPEPETFDLAAELVKVRSAEDTESLQQYEECAAAIRAIQRVAAQAHHDIESLTEETIGRFEFPKF